jgi:predicted HAD superfamily Cof-like phosphohydrolase
MMYEQSNVEDFHKEFGIEIQFTPSIPKDDSTKELRKRLLKEEVQELVDAIDANDMVEIVDGIADIMYVALGCAVTYGVDIEPIFREVHRSNMTKKGGHKDAGGKWVKPATFKKPNLLPILIDQGYKP